MLKIRLKRVGRKNRPFYRVVVAEHSLSTSGSFLETLGSFDPRNKKKTLILKKERIKHWLSKGAGCSPVIHNLLVDKGLIKDKKVKASSGRKKKKQQDQEDKGESNKDQNKQINQTDQPKKNEPAKPEQETKPEKKKDSDKKSKKPDNFKEDL